jgi:hypothetical protein
MQKKHIILVLVFVAAAGFFLYRHTRGGEEGVPGGKLNIQAVCEGALAYMSFTDGAAAEAFVEACVRGEHPEVIERYKQEMGLGDGAAI